MVAGVRLQLQGERDAAIWTAKRNACTGFVAAVDHFRSSVIHDVGEVSRHFEDNSVTADQAAAVVDETKQRYKRVLAAQAALRLSVDSDDVDTAESLVNLGDRYLYTFFSYSDSSAYLDWRGELFERLDRLEQELDTATRAWTQKARHNLAASRVSGAA